MKNFLFLTIVILFNYFTSVYSENSYYVVSLSTNGSGIPYDEETEENQQLIDISLNDNMNDIYNIIEDNQDTYTLKNGKQDAKLEEFDSVPLRKRDDSDIKKKLWFKNKRKSDGHSKRSLDVLNATTNMDVEYILFESILVNYVCPIKDYYAIIVYLSDETAKIVCHLSYVLYCEKSEIIKIEEPENPEKPINNNNEPQKVEPKYYYDIDAIQKETNWTSVSVQPSPNEETYHLSLISQSNEIEDGQPIDMNYYYPSSAGQGIDIYILDDGIIVHPEYYDTYEGTEYERTITCDAIANSNDIRDTTDDEKKLCIGEHKNYPDHGIATSSTAAGSKFGVAKKANLHMIAKDNSSIAILRSIDYVLRHAKPHKTILSMSFGELGNYHQSYDDKLSDLINAGIIVLFQQEMTVKMFVVKRVVLILKFS